MLAEATTIQKAKSLKDLSLVAEDWAKRTKMGAEAVQYARSYALMAERRLGELLREKPPAKHQQAGPGRGNKTALSAGKRCFSDDTPTLAELGVSWKESAEAQRLAALPDPVFKQVVAGKKTRTEAKREVRRKATAEKVAALPADKYRVLYADPPWKYGDGLMENYGPTGFHYPTMSIADLCALGISDLATNDAVLFFWVTSPMLDECWPVIRAWGFEYKTSFVWDKVKHNMGHYNSVRHELLLVCTRGSCLPDVSTLIDSVQSIERQAHSEKPEEFRTIIDKLYPKGKRIELFARKAAKGWERWGNQL